MFTSVKTFIPSYCMRCEGNEKHWGGFVCEFSIMSKLKMCYPGCLIQQKILSLAS